MDVIAFVVANAEPALIEQPVECGFHDVAVLAESTAVRCVALGDEWQNATSTQRFSNLLLCVVRSIRQQHVGTTSPSPAVRLLDGRNRVHEFDRHLRVVNIGRGVGDGQRRAGAIGDQVTLCAVLAPIGGIGPSLCPPKSARVEQLSMAATAQSMPSARPSSSSRTRQIFFHTPAACQSRRRRQQVMPDPQPISCGSNSH